MYIVEDIKKKVVRRHLDAMMTHIHILLENLLCWLLVPFSLNLFGMTIKTMIITGNSIYELKCNLFQFFLFFHHHMCHRLIVCFNTSQVTSIQNFVSFLVPYSLNTVCCNSNKNTFSLYLTWLFLTHRKTLDNELRFMEISLVFVRHYTTRQEVICLPFVSRFIYDENKSIKYCSVIVGING